MYGFEILIPKDPNISVVWSPLKINGESKERYYYHVYPKKGFSGGNPSGTFGFCFPIVLQHPYQKSLFAILASKFSYDFNDFICETINNVTYANSSNDFHIHKNIRLVDAFICRQYKTCCHCVKMMEQINGNGEHVLPPEFNAYSETFGKNYELSSVPPTSWWYFWYSIIISSFGKSFLENGVLCETYLKNGLLSDYTVSLEHNYKIFSDYYKGTLCTDGYFRNENQNHSDALIIFKVTYDVYQQMNFSGAERKRMILPSHVHSDILVDSLWTYFDFFFRSQSGIDSQNRYLEFVIPTACFPYSMIFMEMSDSLLTKIYGNGGFSCFLSEITKKENYQRTNVSKQRLRDEYLALSSNQKLASQSSFFTEGNLDSVELTSRTEILPQCNISKVYNRQKITKYAHCSTGPKNQNNYIGVEPLKTKKCGKITYYVSMSKEKLKKHLGRFSEKKIEVFLIWFWDLLKLCAMEDYSKNLTHVREVFVKPHHRSNTQTRNVANSSSKSQDLRSSISSTTQTSDSTYQLLPKSYTVELDSILRRYNILEGCIKAFHIFDEDSFLMKRYSSPESKNDVELQHHFLLRFTIDDLVSRYSCFKTVIETVQISKLYQDVVQEKNNSDLRKSNDHSNKKSTIQGDLRSQYSSEIIESVSSKLKLLSNNQQQQSGFLPSSSSRRNSLSQSAAISSVCVNEAGKDLLISYIFQLVNALRSYHSQNLIHRDLHTGNVLAISCPTIFRINFSFYNSDSKISGSDYKEHATRNATNVKDFSYYMLPFGNPNLLEDWMNVKNNQSSFVEIVALSKKYFPDVGIIDITGVQAGAFNESNYFVGDFIDKQFGFHDKEVYAKQNAIKETTKDNYDTFLHAIIMGGKLSEDSILPRAVLYNSYRNFISKKVFQNYDFKNVPIFMFTKQNAEQNLFLNMNEELSESRKIVHSSKIAPSVKSVPFISDHFSDVGDLENQNAIISISDYSEIFGFTNYKPTNYFIYRAPEQIEVTKCTETNVHRFQPVTNMVDMYSLGIRLMSIICDFEIIYCYGRFPTTKRQKNLNPSFDIDYDQKYGTRFQSNYSFGCNGSIFGSPYKCNEGFNQTDYGLAISRTFYKGPINWTGLENNTHKNNYEEISRIVKDNFSSSSGLKTMFFDYTHGFLPENMRLMSFEFENSSSSNPLCNDFCSNSKHITDDLVLSKSEVQFSKKTVISLCNVITSTSNFKNDFWLFSSLNRQRFVDIQQKDRDSEVQMVVNIVLMHIDACGLPSRYKTFLDSAIKNFLDLITDVNYTSFSESFMKKISSYRLKGSGLTEITAPYINKTNYGSPSKFMIDHIILDSLPYSIHHQETQKSSRNQYGVLDNFFKLVTNSIFEIFAIYVICENIITDLVHSGKENLKNLSTNFDRCASQPFKTYIRNTCLLSYGVDPLDELSRLIRNLDRTVHKPTDSTVLEYNDMRRKYYYNTPQSSTNRTKLHRWSIERDYQPSNILLEKITGKGYLLPTLKNFLINKYKFGQNNATDLSNIIYTSVLWDPLDRPSTLEYMHLNIFNRFKLIPDTFDIVKNESKCFSTKDIVINPNENLDVLTIHFHSTKNHQLCNQSFGDENHVFSKMFSSDFSTSRFMENRLSIGIDNMTISAFNSHVQKADMKMNRKENIFYLGSVSKDHLVSKKMIDTSSAYLDKFIKSKNQGHVNFDQEFAVAWNDNVLPNIMKFYHEISVISPMVGNSVPRLSVTQQTLIMRNIILSGFLSLPDKKSIINPVKSSFDSVFVDHNFNLKDGSIISEIGFFVKFDGSVFENEDELINNLKTMMEYYKEITSLFANTISSQFKPVKNVNLSEQMKQNYGFMFIVNDKLMEYFNV